MVLFADYPGEMVRGVRFIFDRSTSGAIWVTNVRVAKNLDALLPFSASGSGFTLASDRHSYQTSAASAAALPALAAGRIASIRRAASVTPSVAGRVAATDVATAATDVEIEVASSQPIPVRDALLTLDVGGTPLTQSRFASDGTTSHAVFTMPRAQFDALHDGAALTLVDGAESQGFGSLDKSVMQ